MHRKACDAVCVCTCVNINGSRCRGAHGLYVFPRWCQLWWAAVKGETRGGWECLIDSALSLPFTMYSSLYCFLSHSLRQLRLLALSIITVSVDSWPIRCYFSFPSKCLPLFLLSCSLQPSRRPRPSVKVETLISEMLRNNRKPHTVYRWYTENVTTHLSGGLETSPPCPHTHKHTLKCAPIEALRKF